MTTFPKISIVTPSYNQGHFIEETIISIIGQGYPNLEYIVMDGGSTDNTVDILKKYDSQITYWQSEKDKGQADAINQGFERATGDVLMWLNSDDMLTPNSLFYISEQVKQKGDGFYFGNCIHFKESDALWAEGSDVAGKHAQLNLKDIDYIIQPSSFWTRKVWEETGELNIEQHFTFDWEWFVRISEKFTFYPSNKVLSLYRFHDEHKSGSGGNKRQLEILTLLEKNSPKYAKLYEMLMYEEKELKPNLNFYLQKLRTRIQGDYFSYAKGLKTLYKKKYIEYSEEDIYKMQSIL